MNNEERNEMAEKSQLPQLSPAVTGRPFPIAGALIAVSAFSYAAGYLVVGSFHEGLNLYAPSGDYFRVEYLHIGLLCNLSIGCIAIPSFWFFLERALVHKHLQWLSLQGPTRQSLRQFLGWKPKAYCYFLTLGLYLQLLFSPPHHQPWFSQIFLLLAIVVWLYNSFFGGKASRRRLEVFMWIVVVLSFIFLFIEVLAISKIPILFFTTPFPDRGYIVRDAFGWGTFLLLSVFLGRLAQYIYSAWPSDTRDERRLAVKLAPLTLFIYYILLIIFARCIFTHIPVEKGGGDFTYVTPLVVYSRIGTALPPTVVSKNNQGYSRPLIVILQTADSLFVTTYDETTAKSIGKTLGVPPITQLRMADLTAIGDGGSESDTTENPKNSSSTLSAYNVSSKPSTRR